MNRLSLKDIVLKSNKRKLLCLTAYTSSISKIIDNFVDIILIGDSVGSALYGMKNTQSVSLDMMKNHGKTVTQTSKKAFTIIDMPYGSYRNKSEALSNAKALLSFTKCQSVKLETDEKTIEIVNHLTKNKIKVVSHIGVTPQKYKNFSKIKAVGKKIKKQEKILKLAKKLEDANSCMIVLECISADLTKKITKRLSIPTIGIGSSVHCNGQILVINDILGYESSSKKPKFVKSYAKIDLEITKAVKKYCKDVLNKKFPSKKYSY